MSLGSYQPQTWNYRCRADSDFPGGTFTLFDEGGDPWDLTGVTLSYTVRSFDDAAGSALISVTPTITNAALGQFTISIDKAVLAALPRNNQQTNKPTMFRHRLGGTSGSGGTNDFTLLEGDLAVWGII